MSVANTRRTKSTTPRRTVAMTEPQWRALAAVLFSALTITTDPIHLTLIKGLYDEIQSQVNIDINPVPAPVEEPDSDEDIATWENEGGREW